MIMSRYFITFTPYHLLLSIGLTERMSTNSEENVLIFVPNFLKGEEVIEKLRHISSFPFSEVIRLRDSNTSRSTIMNYVAQTINTRRLKRKLSGRIDPGSQAYIPNDSQPEGQILALMNTRSGGESVYLEDGLAAYLPREFKRDYYFVELIMKLLFGSWYERIDTLGSSRYIDSSMVFYPEIVLPKLRRRGLDRLPEDLLRKIDGEILKDLRSAFCAGERDWDCFLILPNSESLMSSDRRRGLLAKWREVLTSTQDAFDRIICKYHPREKETDYLELSDRDNMELVPRHVPTELILLNSENRGPKTIVGDLSTSLITSRMILEESTIVCVSELLGRKLGYRETDILERNSIGIPSSLDEFRSMILAGSVL